jgi:hypothetical protein
MPSVLFSMYYSKAMNMLQFVAPAAIKAIVTIRRLAVTFTLLLQVIFVIGRGTTISALYVHVETSTWPESVSDCRSVAATSAMRYVTSPLTVQPPCPGSSLVTRAECWTCGYDSEAQLQSSRWTSSNSSTPKQEEQMNSRLKRMFIISFDITKISSGRLNTQFCIQMLHITENA